jgi:glycosyltransferase involved in cell wall biosynthesis
MREPKISALIVAKNEAETLPACLASLGWVHEVVIVVDAASKDITEKIARRRADRVLVRPFTDFASQRNAALALASGDWVFAIDADERVPGELSAEIRSTLANPRRPYTGYHVPIRSIVLGRPFGYSGTQDDKPLRLFRRGLGKWVGEVHETVKLRGNAGTLQHALRHRTIPDMHTFLRKIDSYTTLQARRLHREGVKPHVHDFTIRPLWTFAKLYLAKRGYRDGLEGLAFCALSAVSVAVCKWKLKELLQAEANPLKNVQTAIPRPHTPRLQAARRYTP